LPPQRRRLSDIPGFAPALRIAAGVAVALLIIGGAVGAVVALERGALPASTIPLASLAVLAATAAYLAGRAEGKHDTSTAAERSRAKGRLQKGASNAANRAAAGKSASAATGTDGTGAVSPQAGSIALRTKFLDDISQALRAPITSICLAARIIRKHYDSTPEVVAHFGDTLLAEADRLGQTVDEFLELARLESGLVEWREDEVDAADLIQRAVAEVESVAVSYGVSVAFTMEPGLPPLHVDRERIAQALTILLAMAVRSASEGSEIVIQIAGAHGGWVFTVGGTSFVYPHAEARKVHVRADGAPVVEQPESRPDGLGLGLCLCREIVARYQGRFWIEGTPGTSGCARFTVPYRQHRRATIATTASTDAAASATVQSERPKGAPGTEPGYAAGASAAPVDLELRRELAVKTLQERAASQPRVDAATPTENDPAEARTAQSSDIEPTTHVPDARSSAANVAGVATDSTAATPAATETSATVSEGPADERAATQRPGAKISFGRRQTTAETPAPPRPAPILRDSQARPVEPAPDSLSASDPAATPRDSEPAEHAVEVEVEVEYAPVQAPVSGTMITATHRTAGPPVLANPGVPALSGVQSAATAAMQGSDELLLEIAEAQSPDGHALIVSEEVRSLLASAPGTLPAVAGQNAPAVAGRGTYTPSRRRMVQAPWVVRSGGDGQPSAPDTPAEGAQAQPAEPAATGQGARLNERLAKRLGLTGSSQPGRNDGRPGAGGAGAYMRGRRIGSR
jgi:signal transduction histidine kinase